MESQGPLREVAGVMKAVFDRAFGRTPLRVRQEDIEREAVELRRAVDVASLREEYGDLLASTLVGIAEAGWDPDELLLEVARKIDRRRAQYAALGRKTKVVLFGGAFDPITRGHVEAASLVLDAAREFDEAWFMPCYRSMSGKVMESANDRIEMCKLAARRDGRIKVFGYECAHELVGETRYVMGRLLEDSTYRDEYHFSFAVGLDTANSAPTWPGWEDLERLVRFVVLQRGGVEMEPSARWCLKSPHLFLVGERPIHRVSSTEVRAWLRGGDEGKLRESLDPAVLEYIRGRGLYGVANLGMVEEGGA